VLLTIWTLANPEAFRSVSDRFGVNRGLAHYLFMNICRQIKQQMFTDFVVWPGNTECSSIADQFETVCGFPGVVGCVDGTHIHVKAPTADRDSYINRKGFPSVNVLAVCDHTMRFIYVFSDSPGSAHDARVLRTCTLGQKLLDDRLFENDELHLLGDAAYPLLPGLMVPFRDNGHLTAAQSRYNVLQSAARSLIERAFGLLKGKFRRLKFLDVTRIDFAPVIIEAACVLHNVCLADVYEDYDDSDMVAAAESDSSDSAGPGLPQESALKDKARQKREAIMHRL